MSIARSTRRTNKHYSKDIRNKCKTLDFYLNRRLESMSTNIPRPVGRKRRSMEAQVASIPMVFMKLLNEDTGNTVKALLDTGASETLVYKKPLKGQKVSKGKKVQWETAAGEVSTAGRCNVQFQLP